MYATKCVSSEYGSDSAIDLTSSDHLVFKKLYSKATIGLRLTRDERRVKNQLNRAYID